MSKDRIESKFFEVAPGVEIHYLEKGEGDPMIFIPGLTFPGEIFLSQIEYFSRDHRVIAMDPRGQGYSGKPVDGNDYQTHGKDLNALIEGLGLTNVVLTGWSTGNLDTWSYVEQFGTDRLKAVCTIDMSPKPLHPDPLWWTEGTIEELCELGSRQLTTPEGCRQFFADYTTDIMIQHEMVDGELEYILDLSARTPYWMCRNLYFDAQMSDYLATAKKLGESFPSLMFIAEHWADIAKPFCERELPGYELYVMGGHLMFYEYPAKWNSVLEEFINRVG